MGCHMCYNQLAQGGAVLHVRVRTSVEGGRKGNEGKAGGRIEDG